MKIAIAFLLAASSVFAQTPAQGERKQQVILATAQPAQTVTTKLSAEAATALESMRLSTPGERDKNGISAPQFATVQELWNVLTQNMLVSILQRFPPAAIKAAQDAAAKATADAQAATAAAVKSPPAK